MSSKPAPSSVAFILKYRSGEVLLKIELKQHRYMPNLSTYAFLFKDYPEELPLLEQAIDYCLRTWNVENVMVSLTNGNTPSDRS